MKLTPRSRDRTERIGLFGGTFDPIHIAHLILAEEALYRAELDRVLLIPNRLPPHKQASSLPASVRAHLVELAVADRPGLELDPRELHREGPSYTVDTLEELAPQGRLIFLCGSDSFDGPWHRLKDVFELLEEVRIFTRPGSPPGLPPAIAELPSPLRDKAQPLPLPQLELSSREIRRRIESGEPYRSMLTEGVYRYIVDHDLYRSKPSASDRLSPETAQNSPPSPSSPDPLKGGPPERREGPGAERTSQ